MSILGGLIQNASLLLALVLAYSLFIERFPRERLSTQLIHGALFGVTALIGMAYPVTLEPGVIFDARTVVIGLAALFAGTIPAAVATLIAIAYRTWLGGDGADMGVATILTATVLGLGFRALRNLGQVTVNAWTLAAFGLVVHLAAMVWVILLPKTVQIHVLSQIALPYLLVFPTVTLLLGLLLRMQEQRHDDALALRRGKERLVEAQRIAGIGDWQWDLRSNRQDGSPEQQSIYGGARVIPATPFAAEDNLYSNETWPALREAIEATRARGEPLACDAEIVRPNASRRWVTVRGEPVRDDSGQITQLRGTVEDITARKAASDALAHERAFLATLIQTIPDLVWLKDPDGVYLACNRRFEQFFGASAQEILGRTDRDFMSEDEAAFFRHHDLKALAAGGPTINEETITFAEDGHQELLETIKTPLRDGDGQVIGVLGVARNIGLQRDAQQALQRERDRVQQILGTVDAIIVALDRDGKITLINRAGCEALGYRPDELEGRDWFELAFADAATAEAERSAHKSAVTQGQDQSDLHTSEIHHRDGQKRTVSWRTRLLRDEAGQVTGSLSAGQDVTEQDELRRRIEKLAAHVPGVLYQYQQWPDGRAAFPYASRGIKAIYGVEPAEVVDDATPAFKVLHPDDLERIKDSIATSIERMETWQERYRVLFRDGRSIWVEGESSPEIQPDGSVLWHGYIRDVTDRVEADQAAEESRQKLLQSQYIARIGDFEWDITTGKVVWSEGMYRLLGYALDDEVDFETVNTRIHHPEDLAGVTAWLQQSIASDSDRLEPNEYRLIRKDGSVIEVRTEGWISRENGQATKVFGTALDITERKRSEAQLKLAASVFEHSREGIIITDADNRIVDVNPSFERITGYKKAQVVGQDPKLMASARHDSAFYANMWNALRRDGFWQGEIWNRRREGELFPEMLSISVVRDSNGELQNYIGVFSDISHIKAHAAQLVHIAHHDHLTSLPNRRLLTDRLIQAVSHNRRSDGIVAVCYLDLDGFKALNDRHGHAVGDQLLIRVAEALRQILRSGDTVARLGGDEFVLLLTDLTKPDDCISLLSRILAEVRAPFVIDDVTARVSASIGVTLCPPDVSDPDTLLRHSDQAMYRAKEAGKNTYHLYDADQDRQMQARRLLREQVRQGIDQQDLRLLFHPQVDLISREIMRVEALIRWQHPQHGLLTPADFLPDIEGTELEVAVGEWVIGAVIRQQQDWAEQGLRIPVSINISGNHLLMPDFIGRLQQLFSEHPGADPTRFELEILETAALDDFDQARQVVSDCRAFGLSVALDDFGTGYSSLAYLRRLPVDLLKIDQSFVRDMLDDHADLEIVESVIRLARTFDRAVTAEGVETLAHAALLAWLGCHLGQGYGITHPLAPDQLPGWMEQWSEQQGWPQPGLDVEDAHPELPLLVAAQNHRYWRHHLKAALDCADLDRAKALTTEVCRFQQWYQGRAESRFGALREFRAAGQSHADLHRIADDLVTGLRQAKDPSAIAELSARLESASDSLIADLKRLVHHIVTTP
jgi:diguanylate cyclase (GGDEF)-like protein/PAS domain S-box-containing protein